jgi:hypothetical protein
MRQHRPRLWAARASRGASPRGCRRSQGAAVGRDIHVAGPPSRCPKPGQPGHAPASLRRGCSVARLSEYRAAGPRCGRWSICSPGYRRCAPISEAKSGRYEVMRPTTCEFSDNLSPNQSSADGRAGGTNAIVRKTRGFRGWLGSRRAGRDAWSSERPLPWRQVSPIRRLSRVAAEIRLLPRSPDDGLSSGFGYRSPMRLRAANCSGLGELFAGMRSLV